MPCRLPTPTHTPPTYSHDREKQATTGPDTYTNRTQPIVESSYHKEVDRGRCTVDLTMSSADCPMALLPEPASLRTAARLSPPSTFPCRQYRCNAMLSRPCAAPVLEEALQPDLHHRNRRYPASLLPPADSPIPRPRYRDMMVTRFADLRISVTDAHSSGFLGFR